MRYYAFYERVDEDGSDSLVFFEDLTSDSKGFIDYSTYTIPAYNWKSHSGPHYLGCHPTGTFTLGKWLNVDLPYPSTSDAVIKNITEPCPYYIYRK